MKFAQANVRSINTSIDLILEASKRQQVDIFALSEIWHPKEKLGMIKRNWNWIAKERKDKQGGGVALMIRKNVKYYERKQLSSDKLEAVWCDVYSADANLVIGSVYIPPNDSNSMKELFRKLESLKKENMPILLVGDLNATHPLWGNEKENELGKLVFEFLCKNKELHVVNNADFTRKDKIIDLTITHERLVDKIMDWNVREEVFLNSDHKLISFTIGKRVMIDKTVKWDFKKTDWKCFEEECDQLFENGESSMDVEERYQKVCESIHEAAEKWVKKKTVCIHSKGWWSKGLEMKAKVVRKRKRMFHKRSDPNNKRQLDEAMKEFKEAEQKAKEDYMQEMTELLDPRDPQKFWKIINNERKGGERHIVQPILSSTGKLATSDEEILKEFLEYYGKEVLEVEEYDRNWFREIEEKVREEEEVQRKDMNIVAGEEFENREIFLQEVKSAIEESKSNSAPNPEEKIYIEFLKKGGKNMLLTLCRLFQDCWEKGVIPAAFKFDTKIILPKQGKEDYNTVRSYRPITLESVIGKVFERVVAGRLRWKCEVEGIFADSQEAYRKNRSCLNSVGRMVQSLQTAKAEGKVSVVTVMDYESCFERVWRAGLMHKARELGIKGRLWVYLHNYLKDRKYKITVNGKQSRGYTSKVGIPQGSVLSPFLCNIYTNDAMKKVTGHHTEFADDGGIWRTGDDIKQVVEGINKDIDRVANEWCRKWNMGVATDKTETIIIKPDIHMDVGEVRVKMKGKDLAIVKQKRILGVVIDEDLSFHQHVLNKTKAGFKALSSISHFGHDKRGCSQETFLRLYKSLVLPVLDFGSPVLSTAIDFAEKEFNKVQRKALLTATGCMSSTATEQMEIMTGVLPMSLHLRKKNAEELTRIYSKTEGHLIKEELEKWMEDAHSTKACSLRYLLSQFNELKGKVDLDHVESDFKYTKEGGLSMYRQVGYINDQEEHRTTKDDQADNVAEVLKKTTDKDICVFTDGSALGNPGPTGAGACLYMEGLNSDPIQLKRPISPSSNNYIGELNGIHLALSWLDSTNVTGRGIHMFVDCQPAIRTIFSSTLPTANIALVVECRKIVQNLEAENTVSIHWTPGHKGIQGNEMADRLAKEAAKEMVGKPEDFQSRKLTKKEVSVKLLMKAKEKWQRHYENTCRNEIFQEIYPLVQRQAYQKRDRKMEVLINQLQTGHCRLNHHMAKIDGELSENCDICNVPETVEHFLFQCEAYESERNTMMRRVENAMHLHQQQHPTISLRLLFGQEENSKELSADIKLALEEFLTNTRRFKSLN